MSERAQVQPQTAPSPNSALQNDLRSRPFEDESEQSQLQPSTADSLAHSDSPPDSPSAPPTPPSDGGFNFAAISLFPTAAPIQRQLTIGQRNAPYEQEADQVAEQVMRMSDPVLAPRIQPQESETQAEPSIQTKPFTWFTPEIQRQAEGDEQSIHNSRIQRQVEEPEGNDVVLRRMAPQSITEADHHLESQSSGGGNSSSAQEGRSLIESTEQPPDKQQAQADAQHNAKQIAQSGKPEFSRSVELTPQTEASQPTDTPQASGNSLADAAKEAKPEEIALPKAALTGKSGEQTGMLAEGDRTNSGESTNAPAQDKSNEDKLGAAGAAAENNVTKGALDKTTAQVDQVKTLEQQAAAELTGTYSQVAQLTNTPVMFAASKRSSNRSEAAEVEQRQAVATARANELVAYGGSRLQNLLALGQTALSDIQPAALAAQAAVDQSLAQNRATVVAQINGMRAQVSSQAKAAQAQITQKHRATIPAIQTATSAARQRIEAAHTAALAALTTNETTQTERIHQLYSQGEKDFRAAGPKVGDEALAVGRRRKTEYLSQRNGESDLLDGPLHDNRLEAKADAAVKVAEAYKKKLVETANEQADKSREGKPKDLDTVRQVVSKSRETLQTQYQNALDGLTQAETQAISQATEAKNRLLQNVDQSLNATLNTLTQQQETQLQQLDDYGQQQKMAIARDAEHAGISLQQGLTDAASTLQEMLQAFIANAQETEAPDEATLLPVIEQIQSQFDGAVTQAEAQYQQSTALSMQGVDNSGQQACQILDQSAQSSIEELSTGVAAFTDSMGQITQSANTTFDQMQSAHTRTTTSSADAAVKGFQDITTGITTLFSTLNRQLEDGFKQSATGLENSLRQAVSEKLEDAITTNADEAAAQVQPRWKTALKVLLVIVVIVVVALVVGPAVIGAVGAFAGALGAGTAAAGFIGATVGGAIVGAAAGATIQMGNNIIDGKDLLHDVGKAMLVGAIGGALGGFGGALGQFLAQSGRLGAAGLGQTLLKFGLERVFDVAGGIAGNVAVGDPITLEGILTGLAIAGAVSIAAGSLNNLGRFGKFVQSAQEGSLKAGTRVGGATGAKVAGALGIKPNVPSSSPNVGSSNNTAKDDGNTSAGSQSEADSLSNSTSKDDGTTPAGNQSEVDNPSNNTAKDDGTTPAGNQSEADNTSNNTTKDDGNAPSSNQAETEGSSSSTTKDDGTTSAGSQSEAEGSSSSTAKSDAEGSSSSTAKDDGTTSTRNQFEVDNTSSNTTKDDATASSSNQAEEGSSNSTAKDDGTTPANSQSEAEGSSSSTAKSDAEGSSSNTAKDDGATSTGNQSDPEVTIKGTADAAHESPQAKRFGQLEGGGEFEFLGNSSEGIEGYFTPKGSTERVPVSFKNMPDVKSVKGAFREMRQNVPHVVKSGAKDPMLFTSLPKYTTEDVLGFLATSKPNVLPQPGVFKRIMIDCKNGVVVIDAAGNATKL